VATEEQIDQATTGLLDAVDHVRGQLDPDSADRIVEMAVFRLAVQVLGGRDQLAQAARRCGEVRHG